MVANEISGLAIKQALFAFQAGELGHGTEELELLFC